VRIYILTHSLWLSIFSQPTKKLSKIRSIKQFSLQYPLYSWLVQTKYATSPLKMQLPQKFLLFWTRWLPIHFQNKTCKKYKNNSILSLKILISKLTEYMNHKPKNILLIFKISAWRSLKDISRDIQTKILVPNYPITQVLVTQYTIVTEYCWPHVKQVILEYWENLLKICNNLDVQ